MYGRRKCCVKGRNYMNYQMVTTRAGAQFSTVSSTSHWLGIGCIAAALTLWKTAEALSQKKDSIEDYLFSDMITPSSLLREWDDSKSMAKKNDEEVTQIFTTNGEKERAPIHATQQSKDATDLEATDLEDEYNLDMLDQEWQENAHLLAMADEMREKMELPPQSLVRSVAVLVYEDLQGITRQIVRSNWESSCFIQNSTTAIQAVLSQLANQDNFPVVSKIVTLTDSPNWVLPGASSREMMAESCDLETQVVICGSKDLTDYFLTSVGELYPHSNIYSQLDRIEMVLYGQHLSQHLEVPQTSEASKVYEVARLAAQRDIDVNIHPLSLGAAVLFEDETIDYAWQQKDGEYSSSLDPVSLLAMSLERKRLEGIEPKLVLQIDQFGILHAPLAPARAFLATRGYEKVKILVHDRQGKLHEVSPSQLLPQASDILGSEIPDYSQTEYA